MYSDHSVFLVPSYAAKMLVEKKRGGERRGKEKGEGEKRKEGKSRGGGIHTNG